MEPAGDKNKELRGDQLDKLISIRDELREAKAKRDAIVETCSKSEIIFDDLLSPVIDLHQQMLKEIGRMDEDKKVSEIVENVAQYLSDKLTTDNQEKIRSLEDALSKRINQLNDDKKVLSELENDVRQQEKEKLDLEDLIEATEAELKQQREIRKQLSSTTLTKEISELEAECRHLENEHLKLDKKVEYENLELQALRDKKKIISQETIAQENEYRKKLSIYEEMTTASNDYETKYERELEKNRKIMLKVELIERERGEAMDKLNLKISQHQDAYDKLQNDYDEITKKMISEFGDVESVEQMILEGKAKLAKRNIDCETIDHIFKAECDKEHNIVQRVLKIMAKEAELKQKFDQKMLDQLNVGASQHRNDVGASQNRNDVVETEHDFVQPHVVPTANVRKVRKSRSQRPKQAATKAARNVPDSSVSELSLSPSNPIPEVFVPDEHTLRCWRALQLLNENYN